MHAVVRASKRDAGTNSVLGKASIIHSFAQHHQDHNRTDWATRYLIRQSDSSGTELKTLSPCPNLIIAQEYIYDAPQPWMYPRD